MIAGLITFGHCDDFGKHVWELQMVYYLGDSTWL